MVHFSWDSMQIDRQEEVSLLLKHAFYQNNIVCSRKNVFFEFSRVLRHVTSKGMRQTVPDSIESNAGKFKKDIFSCANVVVLIKGVLQKSDKILENSQKNFTKLRFFTKKPRFSEGFSGDQKLH